MNIPSLTPPKDPKHQTQKNFLRTTHKNDPTRLDKTHMSDGNSSLQSPTGSNHDFPPGMLSAAYKTKYSHARRAADAHSIIFEEDLDSDGELERTTYYNEPVKNFDLNEEQIGQSYEHESETERIH